MPASAESIPSQRPTPKLVVMPAVDQTPQRNVLSTFEADLDNIDNFVILANTTDGKIVKYHCLDGSIPFWTFVEACKTVSLQAVINKLDHSGRPAGRA